MVIQAWLFWCLGDRNFLAVTYYDVHDLKAKVPLPNFEVRVFLEPRVVCELSTGGHAGKARFSGARFVPSLGTYRIACLHLNTYRIACL